MTGDLQKILPSVGHALGIDPWNNHLGFPESRHAVVMVIDGLGYEQLSSYYELAPYLSSLLSDTFECGVPSTTATSLTSLATGLGAGHHGIVGYTMRIPNTRDRLNALTWDHEIDPREFQPHDPLISKMAAEGIHGLGVNLAKFENSGLTRCTQRGYVYAGADTAAERTEAIMYHLESVDKACVYTYEPWLDNRGHAHGVGSTQWRDMLSQIDADARDLREQLPEDTLFVITADHGMINVADSLDIDSIEGLRDDVVLIAGEARFRHIYTRAGAEQQVHQTWVTQLEGQAEVLTRSEAIAAGWFGEVSPSVEARIGDVVAAALGETALFSSQDFPREMSMTGFHGSITPAERLIPILVDR